MHLFLVFKIFTIGSVIFQDLILCAKGHKTVVHTFKEENDILMNFILCHENIDS